MGAAQVQLIPASQLAPGQAAAIRNEAVRAVVELAAREAGVTAEQLVVRDMRPSADLDSTNYAVDSWARKTGTTASAYETLATGTNGSDRWFALYGVKTDESHQSVSLIKVNIGNADKAIWDISKLGPEDNYVGLCNSPVLIPQNDPYTISRYVVQASVGNWLVLLGMVVERRGKVLSP